MCFALAYPDTVHLRAEYKTHAVVGLMGIFTRVQYTRHAVKRIIDADLRRASLCPVLTVTAVACRLPAQWPDSLLLHRMGRRRPPQLLLWGGSRRLSACEGPDVVQQPPGTPFLVPDAEPCLAGCPEGQAGQH